MVAWFLLDVAVLVLVCVAALAVVRLSIVEPALSIRACQLDAAHPPKGMGDSDSLQILISRHEKEREGKRTNNSA